MLPAAPLEPRRSAMWAWTGRLLIVAGGFRFGSPGTFRYFRDAAAYNPATRTWRKLAPMPAARAGGTALWDGTEMLFIGGLRPGTYLPAVHSLAYNPVTNHWRWLPAMKFPRQVFAALWTGHQVLVWGGLTGTYGHPGNPPHGEAYNPVTSKWTALPAAPLRGRAYSALPGEPGVQRASAVLGSALAVFAVLLLGARLLLVRPAPFRAFWPAAVLGAALVTVVLNGGASLLAREQERIPAACAEFHLTTQNSPPVPGGPPPAADEPG